MDQESLSKMLEKCLSELHKAYEGDCDAERAERNAALFLEMQIKLAEVISQAELRAKSAKNEIDRLSAEKYFEFKSAGGEGKKMTEVALEQSINKDVDVNKVKAENIKFEAEYKKWNFIMQTLSNGHIYFRNVSKRDGMI